VMKVAGNGVPGAVGQGRCALLPGLEMPWINRMREVRQDFCGGAQGELDDTGCLSAVSAGLDLWVEPLWVSVVCL